MRIGFAEVPFQSIIPKRHYITGMVIKRITLNMTSNSLRRWSLRDTGMNGFHIQTEMLLSFLN